MDSPQNNEDPAIAKAKVGQRLILSVKARRTASGVTVTLTGGAEIAELTKRTSTQEGHRTPKTYHGLSIWTSLYALEVAGVRFNVPEGPQLGSWVLRASQLGQEGGLTFTLALPHSREKIIQEVERIGEQARVLYREFCKNVTVTKQVFADAHGQILVDGAIRR